MHEADCSQAANSAHNTVVKIIHSLVCVAAGDMAAALESAYFSYKELEELQAAHYGSAKPRSGYARRARAWRSVRCASFARPNAAGCTLLQRQATQQPRTPRTRVANLRTWPHSRCCKLLTTAEASRAAATCAAHARSTLGKVIVHCMLPCAHQGSAKKPCSSHVRPANAQRLSSNGNSFGAAHTTGRELRASWCRVRA